MTRHFILFHRVPAAAALVLVASPAAAELPQPVRDMVDAAIATGDAAKVDAVVSIAKQTNPDDAAELDSLQAGFRQKKSEEAAQAAARKEEEIRSAGLLENWSGSAEVGASRSTGNTSNTGVSVALRLERKGVDWQHMLKGSFDFQRSNGVTSREKYLASYEPRYNLSKRAFAFGVAQYERNPFQGFSGRYAVSGGVGYRVFDEDEVQLSVKAGPAWRRTSFVEGGGESSIAALFGFDFDWEISDRVKLTQDMNMLANAAGSGTIIIDANNTSINLDTGLEVKVSDRFSTRLGYAIDYDSDPPDGKVQTDTLSKVTLVYGF